jgi:hypothetical protein
MKPIKAFLKTFDSEFITMIFLGSALAAFMLVSLYDFSTTHAILLAPLAFLSIFFGLIAIAHILSFIFGIIEKRKRR